MSLADILRTRRSKKKYLEAEALLLAARPAATAARDANEPGALKATQVLVQLYAAWRKPEESAKGRAALPAGQPGAGSPATR